MLDIAAKVAGIRAAYGPDEHRALAVYGDAHAALEEAGLYPYVETRGGLALCAYADNGTLFVVACEDSLPFNRKTPGMLRGWHLSHVPEDGPAPAWRCVVYDTAPACLCCGAAGDLHLTPLVEAVTVHLATCAHGPKEAAQ
ncbi:hypothetical protein ACFY12_25710 [Streptomyces sp. NPDC001339]|uniref:hypothetical protein n=1 Tax=Streptomyces sp. NPDC001339 TaxID=3364563 RepID=UPI0036B56EC1